MMNDGQGILLPTSTLSEPWFMALAAFVAINTIVYMGLTLSKLFPWPSPIHPDRIRQALGIRTALDEGVLEPVEPSIPDDNPSEFGSIDTAKALAWLGGVMLVVGAASTFFGDKDPSDLMGMGVGLALLGGGQILIRTKTPAWATSWIWTGIASAISIATALDTSLTQVERFGFILVIVTISGLFSLTWTSLVTLSAFAFGSYVAVAIELTGGLSPEVLAPMFGAMAAAAMSLGIRRRSLGVISQVDRLSQQLGGADVLTGVLTRQGVLTLLPTVLRSAERANQGVYAIIIDVDNLAAANRDYGTGYGDDLLRAVAAAVRSSARDADLLGRWGGDEFILTGAGAMDSIYALTTRIEKNIGALTVSLGKAPLSVSIGSAIGDPKEDFSALVARALADPSLTGAVDAETAEEIVEEMVEEA